MENAQPEPSMEEILASIRRIISEDEDDQGAPAAKAAPEKAAPPSAPQAAPKPELTLTPATSAAPDRQPDSRPRAESPDLTKKPLAAPMQNDIDEEILDQTAAAAASC